MACMMSEWYDIIRALDHFNRLQVRLALVLRPVGQPAARRFYIAWEHMARRYFDRFRARGGLFIHTLRGDVDDVDVLYRLIDDHF
jgi:hypothetical protein